MKQMIQFVIWAFKYLVI